MKSQGMSNPQGEQVSKHRGLLNDNASFGQISVTAQGLLNRSVSQAPLNEHKIRGMDQPFRPHCFGKDDQDLPYCETCTVGAECYRARWGA